MALIRWEPARELQTIQQEMNRLFGTYFDSHTGVAADAGQLRRWIPAMDLVEQDDHFLLRVDLPGVPESDVHVELQDDVLSISGERRSRREERRDGYQRLERASGSFSRSLTLPEGIDADAIDAHFDNGVLELRIPKPEERQPRKVAINVGGRDGAIEGTARQSA